MRLNPRLATLIAVAVLLDVLLIALPPGLSSLDARAHYSADDALAFIGGLGADGRARYLRHELVDLAFIATYAALGQAIAMRLGPRGRWLRRMVLAGGAADLLETTGILFLLRAYPAEPRPLAAAVSVATSVKWFFAAAVCLTALHARLSRS
jgi:hypothetical protein